MAIPTNFLTEPHFKAFFKIMEFTAFVLGTVKILFIMLPSCEFRIRLSSHYPNLNIFHYSRRKTLSGFGLVLPIPYDFS